MTTRKYGWKASKPDSRDYKLKTVNPAIYATLPASVDLRPFVPEVLDQGDIGSCFSGDTIIPLLNGNKRTLKELAEGIEGQEFWIYSIKIINDKAEIVPALASANLTRKDQKLTRIILDNNEFFDCTPDHKLLTREGIYLDAKDITIGQSMMPFNRKLSMYGLQGYEMIENPGEGWHYTHRIVNKFNINRSTKKGEVIHHKDFNKLNNTPENLQLMDTYEHLKLHAELASWKNYNGTEEQREHSKQLMTKLHAIPDWSKKINKRSVEKRLEKLNSDPVFFKEVTELLTMYRNDVTTQNKRKAKVKQYRQSLEGRDQQRKISKKSYIDGKLDAFIKSGKSNLKNSIKLQILKHGKYLIDNKKEFNEENWISLKNERNLGNLPKFNTALKYFANIDDFINASSTYNHKVINIIENISIQDVYCLTVPDTENFAINAGIFVHNCTANSLSMAMRVARKKQGLPDQALSRLFIYYNERLMEGTVDQDAGAQLRDGAKVLATVGAPDESVWPYLDSNLYLEPTKQAYQTAVQDEASVYLAVDQTLDEMKLCLHEGFPFVFGATLFPEFEGDDVARTGMVPMPDPNNEPIGGHAILCVGYNNTTQRFTVLNSWGPNWGDHGYCYFPYAYLTNPDLCTDLWTIRSIAPTDPNRTWVVPPVQQDS